MENPLIARLERRILDVADAVISASQPVQDHVMALARPGPPATTISNGVDYEHFSRAVPAPPEYETVPAPRVAFVGSIDRASTGKRSGWPSRRCPTPTSCSSVP
jgi:hypothetical protein